MMVNRFVLGGSGLFLAFFLSLVSIQNVQAQTYCTPLYGPVACVAGMDISNLTLAGETVTLNNSDLCSANGYGDYTNLNHPDLIQGQSYSISVSTGYAIPDFCNVRIWIDYNNDGTFSNSEEIASTNGNGLSVSGTSTFTFTVPFSATAGLHRMRARLVYAGSTSIDPCTLENFGETEDYQIQVISASSGCSGQPSAGNIMGADTVSICANANLNLVDTGATDAGGMTYQWQQRTPAGTGTWTNVSGATSFTLSIAGSTLPASSQYRFIVNCSNSSLSDTSNIITALPNQVATECYCIPEGTNSARYIDSFSTSSGVQNIINNGSGYSANGYGEFTSDSIKQYIGQDFDFSAVFKGDDYGVKIWVDWNHDGIFDTTEVAFQSTSFASSILGTVSIPATALMGATRMRIGISNMQLSGPVTPCETNYAFGEFEDYTLVVLDQAPCSGTPNAGTLPATAAVCSGGSFYLNAIGATSPVGVSGLTGQWQYRSPAGTGVWTDFAGATTPSATVLMPGSPVDVRFIYSCGSNSDTSNIMTTTVLPVNECYCIPEATNPNRFIDNFSTSSAIQNVSNTNSGYSPNGYSVYIADTVIQKRGHPIQFTTDVQGGNAGIKIWVDWDQNGDFLGTGEMVHQSSGLSVSHSGTFTIPHTATEGVTRMRIGSNRSNSVGPATPCETNYDQGEYEDYILVVQACDTPFLDLGLDTTICDGSSITLTTGNTDANINTLWSDLSSSASLVVTDEGVYSVKVSDLFGCSNYDTVIVNVLPIPSADSILALWQSDGSFNFSASGVEHASTFHWDFGDGNTSVDSTPNHAFANNGSYEVTLILTNDCGSDTLTTSIEYTTGINHIDQNNDELQMYPNPANDQLTLRNLSKQKMASVSVFNILGQKIYTQKAKSAHSHQLNVKDFTSGIYTVWITFEDGSGKTKQFEVIK